MGTLSLRKERPEPVQPDDVIPELAPQWEEREPFLGIGGMVGVAYMQGINYFNCRKEFVKEVPAKDRRKMPEPAKGAQVAGHRGVPKPFGSAPVIPQSVVDAHKENAKALQAESQAQ